MDKAGFGLYVHWPFCQAKCPYCDFNSHVVGTVDHGTWAEAMVAELRRYGRETPMESLDSVFFGGGTPSLMAPETVEAVLAEAHSIWGFANDVEITLEANPTSVEAGRFQGYRAAGVNRVSLGVQALDDADLKALGRLHSVGEALAAIDLARSVFERVSFDLIYARQDQSLRAWQDELQRALDFAPDHLSLYQLTVEDGTAFGDRLRAGRLRGLPGEELAVEMYLATQEMCSAAGLPAYEVSNHARSGHESRHNLIYWRGGDWIGIGPGAHGRFGTSAARVATEAWRSPAKWLASAKSGNAEEGRAVVGSDAADEYLMMSLRLSEGSDLGRYQALGGQVDSSGLAMAVKEGLVRQEGSRVIALVKGWLVLNSLIAAISG